MTSSVIGEFEGQDVLGLGVSVRKAGDGLSQALELEPVDLKIGDRGTISIDYVVDEVRFKPVKDTDGVRRVVSLAAEGAVITTAIPAVRKALDKMARRIQEELGLNQERTTAAEEGSE